MNFIEAVKKVREGKKVTSGDIRNGEYEELVIEADAVFISYPRYDNAARDNWLLDNVSTDQILSDKWRLL